MAKDLQRLNNPLEDLIGYSIRRLSALHMTLLAVDLQAFDLRPSDASILVLIGANPRVTQTAIGRALGIKRANMAPLIASLERRGLIRRESVDGRSDGLLLTLHGDRTALGIQDAMRRKDELILAALGAEDGETFAAMLGRVRRALEVAPDANL